MNPADFVISTIDRRERLSRSLAKMENNAQRLAVVLYLMGWHQNEIAEVYGCSRQGIQWIIAEFRRRNGLKVNR